MCITISSILPHLRPPPCPTRENSKEASSFQLLMLYVSLLLTSLGSAGIRPNVVTFAADQFAMTKSKSESGGWNFFNWYYFCMGIATLTALTVVVYIQDRVGWGWGLGIPTIAMALSIVVFLVGSHLYKKVKPGGSPLARVVLLLPLQRRGKPLYQQTMLSSTRIESWMLQYRLTGGFCIQIVSGGLTELR